MKLPGLTFSWKRAIGITQAKQKLARATSVPMTKQGFERKIGNVLLKGTKKLMCWRWYSMPSAYHKRPSVLSQVVFSSLYGCGSAENGGEEIHISFLRDIKNIQFSQINFAISIFICTFVPILFQIDKP